MSEQEKFLDRWSRRKQEAAKEDAADAEAKAAATPAQAAEPENPEPEFDLSKLPPVDTISAATDIRAFLSAGVPAQLTRTALRNAWTADPAIRDFIGLSENSWDFNAPDTIPGFGSIGSVDLREMAEQVFGHAKKLEEGSGNSGSEKVSEQAAAPQPDGNAESVSLEHADPSGEAPAAEAPDQTARANAAEPIDATDGASHKDAPKQVAPLPKRKHGSALPS